MVNHSTLLYLNSQFLQLRPLRLFEWHLPNQDSHEITTLDFQNAVVEKIIKSPLAKRYPPADLYILQWLKKYFSIIEESGEEINETLLEKLLELIMSCKSNTLSPCFKTYFLDKLCSIHVSLKEEQMAISQGSTGLRTWEASLRLSEYFLYNSTPIINNRILELGAGAGLLGIVCSKLGALNVCMTDMSYEVLERLKENIEYNDVGSIATTFFLDWELSTEAGLAILEYDTIICADVTYDVTIIPYLTRVLASLLRLRKGCEAYVAATVRNKDTFEFFKDMLVKNELITLRIELNGVPQIFFHNEKDMGEVELLVIKDGKL